MNKEEEIQKRISEDLNKMRDIHYWVTQFALDNSKLFAEYIHQTLKKEENENKTQKIIPMDSGKRTTRSAPEKSNH